VEGRHLPIGIQKKVAGRGKKDFLSGVKKKILLERGGVKLAKSKKAGLELKEGKWGRLGFQKEKKRRPYRRKGLLLPRVGWVSVRDIGARAKEVRRHEVWEGPRQTKYEYQLIEGGGRVAHQKKKKRKTPTAFGFVCGHLTEGLRERGRTDFESRCIGRCRSKPDL